MPIAFSALLVWVFFRHMWSAEPMHGVNYKLGTKRPRHEMATDRNGDEYKLIAVLSFDDIVAWRSESCMIVESKEIGLFCWPITTFISFQFASCNAMQMQTRSCSILCCYAIRLNHCHRNLYLIRKIRLSILNSTYFEYFVNDQINPINFKKINLTS